MTAPLTGVQRARLLDVAQYLDDGGGAKKADDLRQALDLIDEVAAAAAADPAEGEEAST